MQKTEHNDIFLFEEKWFVKWRDWAPVQLLGTPNMWWLFYYEDKIIVMKRQTPFTVRQSLCIDTCFSVSLIPPPKSPFTLLRLCHLRQAHPWCHLRCLHAVLPKTAVIVALYLTIATKKRTDEWRGRGKRGGREQEIKMWGAWVSSYSSLSLAVRLAKE